MQVIIQVLGEALYFVANQDMALHFLVIDTLKDKLSTPSDINWWRSKILKKKCRRGEQSGKNIQSVIYRSFQPLLAEIVKIPCSAWRNFHDYPSGNFSSIL